MCLSLKKNIVNIEMTTFILINGVLLPYISYQFLTNM